MSATPTSPSQAMSSVPSVPSVSGMSGMSGSLLEGLGAAAPIAASAPRRRVNLLALLRPFRPLAPLWNEARLRYSLLLALAMIGGVAAFFTLRPVPQPDYATAPMDEVLNYTLLTDEFNNLPVDQRLELLKDLIERLKTMSADDSSMMAAFAASINTDKLRKQLEENASHLALDVWDKFALEYDKALTDNKPAVLDKTMLEMTALMETVGGFTDKRSDEEKLAEARRQAKRDQEMLSKGKGITAGQMARMADIMRNRVGQHSSPQQQQRGMQLMRDMTRHLRGQDPSTGKPAKP